MAEVSSPAEHLQSTLRRFYNTEVRDWFSDVDFDDLDIRVSRQSMALACRHRDEDSFMMTVARQMLFTDVRSRQSAQTKGAGVTGYRGDVRRRTKPKVALHFLEDYGDVEFGYSAVTGVISFRLMDHTASTITEPIAKTYATRIKTAFSSGGGFVWRKGKVMCSYADWNSGYQLQLLCRSDTEGRRVIEQVLDIQNDTPDWAFLNVTENAEPSRAYPTNPGQERIFGKTRREPRRRPIADVRFQYAELLIQGIHEPVILVDRSKVLAPALVT